LLLRLEFCFSVSVSVSWVEGVVVVVMVASRKWGSDGWRLSVLSYFLGVCRVFTLRFYLPANKQATIIIDGWMDGWDGLDRYGWMGLGNPAGCS
jgi:hypothetical protein